MRVERILAPNPGPFTGTGTNTYLLVSGSEALVVDPGPLDRDHESAILSALDGLATRFVVVTHTHPDHAPLANPLAADLDVPALGYRPGPDFEPDGLLADGDHIGFGADVAEVVYTPGHSDDHLCFRAGGYVFTGDHIMGGSSVVVEDMAAYLRSLRRLQDPTLTRLYPGHGEQMDDPAAIIDEYIRHRLDREQQIVAAVKAGAGTVGEIVAVVYAEVDPALHPLAAMSVAAHLRKLHEERVLQFTASRDENPFEARVTMKRAEP